MANREMTEEERYASILARLGGTFGESFPSESDDEEEARNDSVQELAALSVQALDDLDDVLSFQVADSAQPFAPAGSIPRDVADIATANMMDDDAVAGTYTNPTKLATVLGMRSGKDVDKLIKSNEHIQACLKDFNEWHKAVGKITQNIRVHAAINYIASNQTETRRVLANKEGYDKWTSLEHHAYLLWKFEQELVVWESGPLHALKSRMLQYSWRIRLWQLVKRAQLKFPYNATDKAQTSKKIQSQKTSDLAAIAMNPSAPGNKEAISALAKKALQQAARAEAKEAERVKALNDKIAKREAKNAERKRQQQEKEKTRREAFEAKRKARAEEQARKAQAGEPIGNLNSDEESSGDDSASSESSDESNDEASSDDDSDFDPVEWRRMAAEKNFIREGEEAPDTFTAAQLRLLSSEATKESLKLLAEQPELLDIRKEDHVELLNRWALGMQAQDVAHAIAIATAPKKPKGFEPRKTPEEAAQYVRKLFKGWNDDLTALRKKVEEEMKDTPDKIESTYRQRKAVYLAQSTTGRQLQTLRHLAHTLSLKDVNATAEVLEDDHGYDPDDDESDPSKFIKALVDEQGKTLAQLVEKVSSSVEDTEVQSGEHDGDDTIATRLLSNADYEQANTLQDFFNSCRELYMDPRFALRLMNQRDGSFALYWLQVMVIAFSRKVVKRGIFRGGLVTSLTGLGKTYIIGGIILEDHNDRLREILNIHRTLKLQSNGKLNLDALRKAFDKLRPNKPYLIVAPVNVCIQMHEDLSTFSSSFDIHFHHSHAKATTAMDMKRQAQLQNRITILDDADEENEDIFEFEDIDKIPESQRFSDDLHKRHKIFRVKDFRKARIVLCPPATYTRRYGPRALADDLEALWLQKVAVSELDAASFAFLKSTRNKLPGFFKPDRSWAQDLQHCWRFVMVDESQTIRKTTSQIHQALHWTEAAQYHCTTATPIWNNERDLRGPLNLLSHPENQLFFRALKDMPVFQDLRVASINPFSDKGMAALRDEGDGSIPHDILRGLLTLDAFDLWVRGGDGFEIQRNAADLFLKNGMIRHTYASSMPPGHPEYSIGASLPKLFRRCVTIKLPHSQFLISKGYGALHEQRLRMQLDDPLGSDAALGINRNAIRALTTAAGAPFLLTVGIPHDNDEIDDIVRFVDEKREKHVKRVQETKKAELLRAMVEEVCHGKKDPWPGYPQAPPKGHEDHIGDDQLPTKDEILSKEWYKWREEVALFELDPVLVFDRLELKRNAPKGTKHWPLAARVWRYLLNLASLNTNEDLEYEGEKVPSGKELFEALGLPPLPDPDKDEWSPQVSFLLLDYLRILAPKYTQAAKQHFDAVRRGEKTSNWCSIPTTQRLLTYYMQLHHMNVGRFHAKLNPSERARMIRDFNTVGPDTLQHMVASTEVGGVGINLQKGHWILIIFDALELTAIILQVIGRAYRLRQTHDVYAYMYHVEGTHDEWSADRAFSATLVQLHASIDVEFFAELTGAVCPPLQNPEDFKKSLKSDLKGFYYNAEAEPFKRLRHITAFENVVLTLAKDHGIALEELLEDDYDEEESDFAGCTRFNSCMYRVPPGWTALSSVGVLRRVYQLAHGTPIPSIVETLSEKEDAAATSSTLPPPQSGTQGTSTGPPANPNKRKLPDDPAVGRCEIALTLSLKDEGGKDVHIWTANKNVLEKLYKFHVPEAERPAAKEMKKWSAPTWKENLHALVNRQLGTDHHPPTSADFKYYHAQQKVQKKAKEDDAAKQRKVAKAKALAAEAGGARVTSKGKVSSAATRKMEGNKKK